MLKVSMLALTLVAIAASASAADQIANIAGNFRCQSDPASVCQRVGQTYTVTQTGNVLNVKSDKGDIGEGRVTSAITASMSAPWNMLGVISADGKQTQWSNGTQWLKQ